MHISDRGVNPLSSGLPVDRIQQDKQSSEHLESNASHEGSRLHLSDLAKDFSKAVQQLDEKESIRENRVAEARNSLENFSPTDEEIDVIMNKLVPEVER